MANPSIPRTCRTCNNHFLVTPNQIRRGHGKYCSRACHREAQRVHTVTEFWKRVKKTDSCWIWLGAFGKYGYGLTSYKSKTKRAHRLAYELTYGVDPGQLCVCHSCDNPACVRPDHLWIGTHADNHNDMKRKGRNKKGDAHWTRVMPEKVKRGDNSYQRRHPEWLARGERHGNARMTNAMVLKMRRMRNDTGASFGVIGNRFGLSRAAVFAAVTGKTWRHVK